MMSRSFGGDDTTMSNKGSDGWVLIGSDDEDSKLSDDSWVLEGCGGSEYEAEKLPAPSSPPLDISPPPADLRAAPTKSDDDIDETKSDTCSTAAKHTAPDNTDHNDGNETEMSTCDELHGSPSDGVCVEMASLKSVMAGVLPCHMRPTAQINEHASIEFNESDTPQARDKLSSYGILKYEAPLQKPLPPGIAIATDITGPGSICSMLCHEEYLQNIGDDKKCYLCRGHLFCPDELPVSLKACDHKFHLGCLRQGLQKTLPNCPKCQKYLLSDEDSLLYLRGNQPSGSMSWNRDSTLTCAEHDGCGSIIIMYQFPSSVRRRSTDFSAYLPDNLQGQELFYRLQAAFLCGLTFNANVHRRFNETTWENIPHRAYPLDIQYCNAELTKVGVPPYIVCKEFYDPLNLVGTDCEDLDAPNDNWITTLEHIEACDISSIWEHVSSKDFLQFVKNDLGRCKILNVDINYRALGSDMLRSFMEEWKTFSPDIGSHVSIVFSGTRDENIEPTLTIGLDLSTENSMHGQGPYFARLPAMALRYCCGGNRMLVFAVIASKSDLGDIILVDKSTRQLPIATLSFDNLNSQDHVWKVADSFQMQVTKTRNIVLEKVKVEKETRSKEMMIIQYLIQGEYTAASDVYNAACDASGMPPQSWAQEVGRYIRYHIRDEDEIKAHFPNLPRRIYISTEDD